MNLKRFPIVFIPLLLIGAAAANSATAARADESHEFVIAANDGYGVQDCLAEAGPCGQVVADAWCEAHGQGPALKFGPQSLFTGALATKVASSDEAYVIRCGQ
jgi:hypothetical protein